MGEIDPFEAVLFDLDGVITSTADQHYAAWKQMFDDFLCRRAQHLGEEFVPFERDDYNRYVDGIPRDDGVRRLLAARGIEVPEGEADDPQDVETVRGLGNRKNKLVNRLISEQGVEVYEGSVALLRHLKQRGVKTALVSSSRNAAMVLDVVGITDLFDTRVDGEVAAQFGLAGKPSPATFAAAAERLGVARERAVVIEDALSGVEAGRNGRFGLVIGVDRVGQAQALLDHGADLVVCDLAELID